MEKIDAEGFSVMGNKPILCLDFDGVLHSYTSGWKGADIITDPPVPGAMRFLDRAVERFTVHVFSSRSNQLHGIFAMRMWITHHMLNYCGEDEDRAVAIVDALHFPKEKPPALVTIDDRAITFDGTWPSLDDLAAFKPWNKKPRKETL